GRRVRTRWSGRVRRGGRDGNWKEEASAIFRWPPAAGPRSRCSRSQLGSVGDGSGLGLYRPAGHEVEVGLPGAGDDDGVEDIEYGQKDEDDGDEEVDGPGDDVGDVGRLPDIHVRHGSAEPEPG